MATGSDERAGRALAALDGVLRPLALYLGGTILIGLAGLIVVAVGFRYLLNAPIFGAGDIAQLLLLAIVTFSVAQSGRTGGQVAVEILGTVMGPRVTRWTDAIVNSLGAIMMVILTLQLFDNGQSAADYGEASSSLVIPFGPFYMLLAVGMALYALVLILEALAHVAGRAVPHKIEILEDIARDQPE